MCRLRSREKERELETKKILWNLFFAKQDFQCKFLRYWCSLLTSKQISAAKIFSKPILLLCLIESTLWSLLQNNLSLFQRIFVQIKTIPISVCMDFWSKHVCSRRGLSRKVIAMKFGFNTIHACLNGPYQNSFLSIHQTRT